jgi:hypothetical protein
MPGPLLLVALAGALVISAARRRIAQVAARREARIDWDALPLDEAVGHGTLGYGSKL